MKEDAEDQNKIELKLIQINAETANSANPNLQSRESKPKITSVQTMNPQIPNSRAMHQISNLRNINSQVANSRSVNLQSPSFSRIINQQPSTPIVSNQQISGQRIMSQQISSPIVVSQPISNTRFINQQSFNPETSSQATSQNFNQNVTQRIICTQPSNMRIDNQIPNSQNTTSQMSNFKVVNQMPNQQNPSPQTFNQRTLTPQFFNQRNSAQHVKESSSPMKQNSSPVKQALTPTKNVLTGVQNCEVSSPERALSINVPSLVPIKAPTNEEDSMDIKITSVCSLAPEFFENFEAEIKDYKDSGPLKNFSKSPLKTESHGDLSLKRKAESPGPSQYFENSSSNLKRSKIYNSRISQGLGKEIVNQMKTETENNQNSMTFETNKEREKYSAVSKRRLVEEAISKANIIECDMTADINMRNNQPSTSNFNITAGNYISMPTNNMTVYMGSGESQEVLKIGSKEAGVSISKI